MQGNGHEWNFSSVASTFIMKWKAVLSAETEEWRECNGRLKREEEVYGTHLKGHKSEPIRKSW